MGVLIKKDIIGVMYYVQDLKSACQWYCNALGFELGNHDFDHFVELNIDGQYVMHLFKDDVLQPIEKAVFTFDTEDIKSAHLSLMSKGIVNSIQNYGDHDAISFRDCEGNALMICQFR